jgi:hypothetical protein
MERPNLIDYIDKLKADPKSDKNEIDYLEASFQNGEKELE